MANMQMTKTPMPEQDPNVRNKNFKEVTLGYTAEMAINEAQRCMQCKKPKCVEGCPVNIRIPEFIAKVAEGDFAAAYEVITSTNALPALSGRVCPQETQCESKCVRGVKGEPVAIGRLERFVADWYRENVNAMPQKAQSNGIKVAVVGSGPSGLTCASELAKKGYEVSIFEALHTAGGVLVYGIPEFPLPKAIVANRSKLKAQGVTVMTDWSSQGARSSCLRSSFRPSSRLRQVFRCSYIRRPSGVVRVIVRYLDVNIGGCGGFQGLLRERNAGAARPNGDQHTAASLLAGMHGQDQHVLFRHADPVDLCSQREFSSSRRSAVSSMASRGIVFLQNDSKEFFDPLVLSAEIEPPEQRLQPGSGVVLGLRRGAGRGMAVRVAPAAVYGRLLARKMRADLFRRARLRRGGYIPDGLPVQLTGGQFPGRQTSRRAGDLIHGVAHVGERQRAHGAHFTVRKDHRRSSAEKSSFCSSMSCSIGVRPDMLISCHCSRVMRSWRGLEPSNGPTMPSSSIWSTSRAARE